MKVTQLYCPSCGASIKSNIVNNGSLYCPYCGTQLYVDLENKEVTINKNININRNETKEINKHYYDEAEIVRLKSEQYKDKWTNITLIIIILSILLFLFLMILLTSIGVIK